LQSSHRVEGFDWRGVGDKAGRRTPAPALTEAGADHQLNGLRHG